MHIPDGYLSPATCIALYAGSAPFWYTSLQRMKRALSTQVIPLLSVFAAFSFIIMMFNLPLPGGTTGHAVGVGIAAIALGPWGGILAISIALVIQAVLFGDGGITAIGANCFNMAIVGSLVAYAAYRAISGRAPIESPRRVIAAAFAGYLSINVAALFAAIEFGIQPLLYHDASGAPLYAPYPLHIAIPAMMIGHLSVAGIAEMVVSAGVVRYLQKTEPFLLRATAPGAAQGAAAYEPNQAVQVSGWRAAKRLWLALAVLLILTPFGILAVGSAWGEWSPEDFSNPGARLQIATASRNQALPAQVPMGLQRLATFWTAPIPRYAPPFLKSAPFGYVLSAIGGAGLIILVVVSTGWLSHRLPQTETRKKTRRGRRTSFVERTIATLRAALEYSAVADEISRAGGVLQRVDPRVKIVGLLGMVVVVAASHRLPVIGGVFAVALSLALASRVEVGRLARLVWIPVAFFTGAVALPAVFLTPGRALFVVGGIQITAQGLRSAAFLVSRAETAATLSALLVLTTPWPWVLKALRILKCPMVLVAILGMTYRYIFVILQTAFDMFESRKSRTVGVLEPRERRRLAASAVGVLMSKSFQLSGDVHLAMRSRGFRGEVYVLQEFRARAADWCWLAAFVFSAMASLWLGL
jgi:cobalt/nickel transport system permease protein